MGATILRQALRSGSRRWRDWFESSHPDCLKTIAPTVSSGAFVLHYRSLFLPHRLLLVFIGTVIDGFSSYHKYEE
jgi:hypothetical protein